MAEKPKKPSAPGVLISESDPKSPASEAYRSLRTNIAFAGLDEPCRSIVVTSATAGEGKTTTVANFGTVAAQSGMRVCIIDSDLRRPALHRMFGLSNTEGLSNALVQGAPLAKVARPTRTPNLSILTSGPLPPNPAELVASKRMHDFIHDATQDFDLILCDTPPVISVSDGVSLAAQCDGVILVVRVSSVPRDVIRRAARQIEAVKGRILGVLLNSVNFRRDAYYNDYYRYYHAYYGSPQER
jgi:protein-tyrosine kinase